MFRGTRPVYGRAGRGSPGARAGISGDGIEGQKSIYPRFGYTGVRETGTNRLCSGRTSLQGDEITKTLKIIVEKQPDDTTTSNHTRLKAEYPWICEQAGRQ